LQIRIEDVYTYIFNLFAIEIGALLALFALFACRPTKFLERIKNTATFASIVANTNITMMLTVVALIVTLTLGLVRLEPDEHVTIRSAVFVGWCLVSYRDMLGLCADCTPHFHGTVLAFSLRC
jgi:hypothetical protein